MDLRNASEKEIREELERRRNADGSPPRMVGNLDFTQLINTVKEGVSLSITQGYENDDFKHYVYEAAITAIYGPEYWQWRRRQNW